MLPTAMKYADSELEQLVQQKIEDWVAGESPDAARFLGNHPEVCVHEHLVLDLLYEEFCIRREAGEDVSADSFCDQFPAFRVALRQALAVREYFRSELAPPSDAG